MINKNISKIWNFIKKSDVIIIFLISFAAFILKYKGFPRGDSHGQLAIIYHASNPEYFKNDFYVNAVSKFDVTVYFTKLVNFVNVFTNNYEIAYIVLLLTSMFFFALAFYKILYHLTKNRNVSLISAIIPLSIYTSKIGIGNAFEIGNYLVPSNIAWVIALWSFYFYLKEKYKISFLMLGVSSMFHILVGVLMYGILAGRFVLTGRFRQILQSLLFFIPFLLVFIPLLISGYGNSISNSEKFINIYAEFRNPWHILPSTWSLTEWAGFSLFFIFFLLIFYKYSSIEKKHKKLFEEIMIIILTYYLIGIIFVELFPIKAIIKLQLFRSTEFLNIIELLFISAFFFRLIYSKINLKARKIILVLAIFAILIYWIYNPIIGRYSYDDSTTQVYDYIKENIPNDAILLTPPHIESARLGTMRSIVVDFKSVPFGEKQLEEWHERLLDMTGHKEFNFEEERRFKAFGGGNIRRYNYLQEGYASLSRNDVLELKGKYGFSYAMFEKPSSLGLDILFENDKYVVYKL